MSFYNSITHVLNKSRLYRLMAAKYKRNNIKRHPFREIERVYRLVFGKKPDICNPSNLIEKIYWMELYADLSMWTKCADKYRMREYVTECGLKSYLPKLLAVWNNPHDFSTEMLPRQFILKSNNGCGTCLVVSDKETINVKKTKSILENWLEIPYGYSNAQLHYLAIPRCIIAEELLINDEAGLKISPHSLVDYKVWCINGKAESILVVYDRRGHNYCLDLYDTDWNRLKDKLCFNGRFEFREREIPKPKCLNEMLEMAECLAKPFVQVRADFYVLNDKPIVGELTMATGYGYFTEDYYQYLGEKIDLTKVKKADIPNYLNL